uniref:Uncharacterized protein n=1 Tax=Micrurus lemniscatus lemniscatus TaxID=129467 RepID=A0A2D4IMQ1_MICLE
MFCVCLEPFSGQIFMQNSSCSGGLTRLPGFLGGQRGLQDGERSSRFSLTSFWIRQGCPIIYPLLFPPHLQKSRLSTPLWINGYFSEFWGSFQDGSKIKASPSPHPPKKKTEKKRKKIGFVFQR